GRAAAPAPAPAPAPLKVPSPPPAPPAPAPPAPPPLQAPPAPQPQQAPPPPPAPLPFDEIQEIEDIDLQEADIFAAPPPVPEGGMELEVFSRDLLKGEAERVASPPPPSPEPAPRPVVAAGHEDSPFEVFTREPVFNAPAARGKTERGSEAGPRKMDIETTAYNLPDVFIPEGVAAPQASPGDELPRTALTQEMDFGSRDDSSPSLAVPATEPEFEPEPEPDLEPQSAVDVEPELAIELEPESGPEMELEPELESATALEPEPATGFAPEVLTEPESGPEIGLEVDLASDLQPAESASPSIAPEQQEHFELPGEEYEDASPEEEPAAADAGRGVFDTETLASIYINQGFYGRAAEIYHRLIAQRPDDAGLRGKLQDVLAMERRESGIEEQVAAVAAAVAPSPVPVPPAAKASSGAVSTGLDQTISQLNALLEAFKGGRPR
ncbi:MAG: hypothetical protein ACYC9Y_06150, partial [Candidatus Methylomirabilia bacterium]